jgi:hypothetical protein
MPAVKQGVDVQFRPLKDGGVLAPHHEGLA